MSVEPTRRATAGAPAKRAEMSPTLLVPTIAQLAARVRQVDADPSQWPTAVTAMVRKAQGAGWGTRVTYSQILDIPTIAGKHKGERQIRHYLAVRLEHGGRGIAAYGVWAGTEDTGWKADHAQAMLFNHWPTTTFGVTELGRLIAGDMHIREVAHGYRLVATNAA